MNMQARLLVCQKVATEFEVQTKMETHGKGFILKNKAPYSCQY